MVMFLFPSLPLHNRIVLIYILCTAVFTAIAIIAGDEVGHSEITEEDITLR